MGADPLETECLPFTGVFCFWAVGAGAMLSLSCFRVQVSEYENEERFDVCGLFAVGLEDGVDVGKMPCDFWRGPL